MRPSTRTHDCGERSRSLANRALGSRHVQPLDRDADRCPRGHSRASSTPKRPVGRGHHEEPSATTTHGGTQPSPSARPSMPSRGHVRTIRPPARAASRPRPQPEAAQQHQRPLAHAAVRGQDAELHRRRRRGRRTPRTRQSRSRGGSSSQYRTACTRERLARRRHPRQLAACASRSAGSAPRRSARRSGARRPARPSRPAPRPRAARRGRRARRHPRSAGPVSGSS